MNLELTVSARLAGQRSPGICLHLCSDTALAIFIETYSGELTVNKYN